jgi:hypothetical protein
VSAWGQPSPAASHSKIDILELLSLELDRLHNCDWFCRQDGSVAYYEVIVDAEEVRKSWPELSPREAKKRRTIAAETLAFKKLVEMMKQQPERPIPKTQLPKDLDVSGRGLNRIYTRAVAEANAPAWSKAGRRPEVDCGPGRESPRH